MVDVGLNGVIELAKDMGTRGHNFKLAIPVCHSDMGRRKFGVRVVTHWNHLPSSVIEANTITAFKSRLDRALGVKQLEIVSIVKHISARPFVPSV